jgi:DNA-binding MarR family transcriptional regulator
MIWYLMIASRRLKAPVPTQCRDNPMQRQGVRQAKSTQRSSKLQGVPDIGLGRLLREANMVFNRALRDELATRGVTFSQYQHLRQLWHEDGLVQSELSRRVGVEVASSTAVIVQLEKRKFIRRRRDHEDRRRIVVVLTPAGRALETALDACARTVNALARSGLTQTEVAALFGTVGKVVGNLRKIPRRHPS